MNLNCQMVLILFQIFKIISSISYKNGTLITTPTHVYINRIINRLVLKQKMDKN